MVTYVGKPVAGRDDLVGDVHATAAGSKVAATVLLRADQINLTLAY